MVRGGGGELGRDSNSMAFNDFNSMSCRPFYRFLSPCYFILLSSIHVYCCIVVDQGTGSYLVSIIFLISVCWPILDSCLPDTDSKEQFKDMIPIFCELLMLLRQLVLNQEPLEGHESC